MPQPDEWQEELTGEGGDKTAAKDSTTIETGTETNEEVGA